MRISRIIRTIFLYLKEPMNNNLLYTVEDKPPFGLSLLLAAQHLLAALGVLLPYHWSLVTS